MAAPTFISPLVDTDPTRYTDRTQELLYEVLYSIQQLSGGSSYTFTNGLTDTAGAVKLGGALTEATSIDVDGNLLSFFGANAFLNIQAAHLQLGGEIQLGQVVNCGITNTHLTRDSSIYFNETELGGSGRWLTMNSGDEDGGIIFRTTVSNVKNVYTDAMTLRRGNVGIKVPVPWANLDVSGSSVIQRIQSTNTTALLQFQNSTTGIVSSANTGLTVGMSGANAIFQNKELGAMSFGTDDTQRINIAADGKIEFYANTGNTTTYSTDGYWGFVVSSPTALLDISGSTTSRASLRIRSGAAPTTPNDGDVWYDGTNLKMKIGLVIKTFTLV